MFENENILNLQECYKFDVNVMFDQNGYVGELELTPSRCKLKIIGESRSETSLKIGDSHIDRLKCETFSQSFILFNLECTYIKSKRVPQAIGSIGFFECEYDVELVVCCSAGYEEKLLVDRLSVFSKELGPWIGLTNKRNNLIKNYVENKQFHLSCESARELQCDIGSGNSLIVQYDAKYIGYTHNSYTVGMSFIPCVTIEFNVEKNPFEVYKSYNDLYFLISFFIGRDLSVDKVVFDYDPEQDLNGSLYFPRAILPSNDSSHPILLPLANDLLFNDLGLTAISDKTFFTYYQLDDVRRNYFYKYRVYSRMESLEERYLGYFRLLEKLCFKKKSYLDDEKLANVIKRSKRYLYKVFNDKRNVDGFLQRIVIANGLKYNTEKCILDFYKEIPEDIKVALIFTKTSISDFCKLRNNITHANHHYISDDKLRAYVKAIELLLLISLFRTIHIEYRSIASVLRRVTGIHELRYFEGGVA